jgi:hypothetical protein
MAHQVDHQGAAGPLRIRRRQSRCATASSATSASTTSPTTSSAGKLWEAFDRRQAPVLLIDEIDKADIEFPNDLLQELDRMEFFVYETGETIKAASARSSSSPRTTRRNCRTPSCAAASSTTSASPTPRRCSKIVDVHFPGIKQEAGREALNIFFDMREGAGPEEEALDLGAARLAQAADGRGHRRRGAAREGPDQADPRRCTARC